MTAKDLEMMMKKPAAVEDSSATVRVRGKKVS